MSYYFDKYNTLLNEDIVSQYLERIATNRDNPINPSDSNFLSYAISKVDSMRDYTDVAKKEIKLKLSKIDDIKKYKHFGYIQNVYDNQIGSKITSTNPAVKELDRVLKTEKKENLDKKKTQLTSGLNNNLSKEDSEKYQRELEDNLSRRDIHDPHTPKSKDWFTFGNDGENKFNPLNWGHGTQALGAILLAAGAYALYKKYKKGKEKGQSDQKFLQKNPQAQRYVENNKQ